jgi:hypothetical protein
MGRVGACGESRRDVLSSARRDVCLGRVEEGRGGLGHAATLRFPSPLVVCLGMKPVGERNARNRHVAFGRHYFPRNGRWYLGASPSKKSVQRIKDKVGEILVPGNQGSWSQVCRQLNSLLRGWRSYFDYGSRQRTHEAVDHHVFHSVRRFLVRRRKVSTHGTRRFTYRVVYGVLGVLRLNPRPMTQTYTQESRTSPAERPGPRSLPR